MDRIRGLPPETFWTSLLAAVLLAVLACTPEVGEPTAATRLVTVPEPDLSASEASVREQIAGQWAVVDELLEDPDAAPEARAEAFGDLGLLYLIYDFLEAAEVCLRNARILAPDDYRWPYLGGYMDKMQGRLTSAAELLERALVLEPALVPALVRLARTRLEMGEHERARELFESALAVDPASAAAYEGLGKVAVAAGDPGSAVEHFETALAYAPEATSLHYALGQAYRNLGDRERARSYLGKRGEVPVRVPDPLLNPLAGLGASAQFYLMKGAEALDNGDYETAAAAYERALAEDPRSFTAYRGLSYAVERLGNLEGAIRHLVTALEKATTKDAAKDRRERAEILRILGGLVALAGRDGEAVEHFERSLELSPDQGDVRRKLANALARTGRFEAAVSHYDQLLAAHPEHAAALYLQRATAFVNLGHRDDAIADFERAVAADPGDAQLRLRYAAALDFLKAPGAAEQRAAAAELLDDARERARVTATEARQHVREGRHADAVELFREAVRLDPDQHSVRHELASALGRLERFDPAIGEYRRVIDAQPRHAAARRGEIVALLRSGRYGEARVRLQEALKLFPQDAELAHTQARLLATVPDPRVRDGALALAIAERLSAVRDDLRVRETLAMACAEAGQIERAIELQKGVVSEAKARGDSALAAELEARLRAFARGEAWTAASAEEIVAVTLAGTPY